MNNISIKYKRDLNKSVMIVETDTHYEGFEEKMISNNEISSLLDFTLVQQGETNSLWYDISGKKSLKGIFLSEGINTMSLKSIIYAIQNAIEGIKPYLLKEENILISLETLFFCGQDAQLRCYLTYVPGACFDFSEEFKSVAEYIVQNVDHEDTKSVMTCYKLFERIYEGDFTLSEILEVLDDYKEKEMEFERIEFENDEEMLIEEEIDFDGLGEMKDFDELENYNLDFKENKKFSLFRVLSGRFKRKKSELFPGIKDYEDFIEEPETMIYQEELGTTVLGPQNNNSSDKRLTYLGNKKIDDIILNQYPFNIGSRKNGNEYFIDEKVISRVHAKITSLNGKYYLEDLESKNGTYINGEILPVNTPYEIFPKDKISFADIDFRFE